MASYKYFFFALSLFIVVVARYHDGISISREASIISTEFLDVLDAMAIKRVERIGLM